MQQVTNIVTHVMTQVLTRVLTHVMTYMVTHVVNVMMVFDPWKLLVMLFQTPP